MMIQIDRGNGIEEMDESLLVKKEGDTDCETDTTHFIEYYLDGKLVHRSVHVQLKKGAISQSLSGVFGG